MGLTCCSGERTIESTPSEGSCDKDLVLSRPGPAIYSPMKDTEEALHFELYWVDNGKFQSDWRNCIMRKYHAVSYLLAPYADEKLFVLVFTKATSKPNTRGPLIMKKYITKTKEEKRLCEEIADFVR
eukprot:TRINITY_DN6041_c0_g1_i10.p1 TRINITY_DN6041_c0_g1~~TRINITY_DN6041_c0_g1_i10.p1  ORF type:complete len:127 (+),score=42.80 TRINITY_DN6041_c0_g1_i10:168-548(+)